MARYYMNEAVVDLPDRAFVDKTIHGLESKLPGGRTLGVLVQRAPAPAGKSLRRLVDENVTLNRKRLLGFAVQGEAEVMVGNIPGFVVRTRWRRERSDLYQVQAHVLFEGTLIIFAVSAPLEERAACDETFDGILATLTWRTD